MTNEQDLRIRDFRRSDLDAVKAFTDRTIGLNYYSCAELEEILRRSSAGEVMTSLVLENDRGEVFGVRITYPPGRWEKGKGHGLSPEQWGVPWEAVAYFQSLFLDPAIQGQGWGRRLSLRSMEKLKTIGARAIVCHSWRESPGDSSGRYLRGLGFELVATHPRYWMHIDYECPRCGKPCLCTADEMILRLSTRGN